jgi:hypothetical protein
MTTSHAHVLSSSRLRIHLHGTPHPLNKKRSTTSLVNRPYRDFIVQFTRRSAARCQDLCSNRYRWAYLSANGAGECGAFCEYLEIKGRLQTVGIRPQFSVLLLTRLFGTVLAVSSLIA